MFWSLSPSAGVEIVRPHPQLRGVEAGIHEWCLGDGCPVSCIVSDLVSIELAQCGERQAISFVVDQMPAVRISVEQIDDTSEQTGRGFTGHRDAEGNLDEALRISPQSFPRLSRLSL